MRASDSIATRLSTAIILHFSYTEPELGRDGVCRRYGSNLRVGVVGDKASTGKMRNDSCLIARGSANRFWRLCAKRSGV
jgi:hypothetical protein